MIDFSPPPHVQATVADRAVQLHGAHGLMKESGIEKIFRIARNLRIPGGTDEIQRVNIAKVLGL
jgi:acyl-CoA dehydrogenase